MESGSRTLRESANVVNFIQVCKFVIVKKTFPKYSKSLQVYISDRDG